MNRIDRTQHIESGSVFAAFGPTLPPVDGQQQIGAADVRGIQLPDPLWPVTPATFPPFGAACSTTADSGPRHAIPAVTETRENSALIRVLPRSAASQGMGRQDVGNESWTPVSGSAPVPAIASLKAASHRRVNSDYSVTLDVRSGRPERPQESAAVSARPGALLPRQRRRRIANHLLPWPASVRRPPPAPAAVPATEAPQPLAAPCGTGAATAEATADIAFPTTFAEEDAHM